MNACLRACVRAGGKEGDGAEETTYMTTITYDCQEGYKRGVGNWILTCLENKEWTGIPPICEGQCACVRACRRETSLKRRPT